MLRLARGVGLAREPPGLLFVLRYDSSYQLVQTFVARSLGSQPCVAFPVYLEVWPRVLCCPKPEHIPIPFFCVDVYGNIVCRAMVFENLFLAPCVCISYVLKEKGDVSRYWGHCTVWVCRWPSNSVPFGHLNLRSSLQTLKRFNKQDKKVYEQPDEES